MKIKFLNTDRQDENFDAKLITVGREEDNLLQLISDGISRHHGKIYCNAKGEWYIEDLDSTNGIKLNGKKISAPSKLAENDTLDFHLEKIQVYDFEEMKTVQFSSVSTDTAKISITDIIVPDGEESISLDPIIPADNSESISFAPVAEDTVEKAKEPELEKLAEFIQQNTNNLFNSVQKKKSDNAENSDKKSKFSNKIFYVTLICSIVVLGSFLIKILEDQKKPIQSDHTSQSKEYPLYLTYIKENISPKNVFRFQLIIEDGQASFSVDDLKSQLRYGPIIKTVSETDLEKLKEAVKTSQFMKLQPVSDGIISNNEREFKELNIVYGPSANHIILKNRPAPREFLDIEEAINLFAESCNMATFSLSPAELQEQAMTQYRIADDKFANYETDLANLREAVSGFNIVIEYLSGITPEPQIRRNAAEKMKRAKEIREKLIHQYRSQYMTMLNQSNLEGARHALETLLKLYDVNSKEYLRFKERLIKVDMLSRRLKNKK